MEKEILLFGGLLLDHYFSVDRWPQRGQDGYVVGQARFGGGCAANMAVTIHNLGGHPHVVSCVGSDHPALLERARPVSAIHFRDRRGDRKLLGFF